MQEKFSKYHEFLLKLPFARGRLNHVQVNTYHIVNSLTL